MWFNAWAHGKKENKSTFPTDEATKLNEQGIIPHYTWEPQVAELQEGQPQIYLDEIINGSWDDYIIEHGKQMAAVKGPVILRWGHEFNGYWYPWSMKQNGGNKDSAETYKAAYRHVHDLVAAQGATNVQWVWTFMDYDLPDEEWNDPAKAYPGDAYVDWIGFDTYNQGGDQWHSFRDMITGPYARAQQIDASDPASTKPIMIAETGSDEAGGSKAEWWKGMFRACGCSSSSTSKKRRRGTSTPPARARRPSRRGWRACNARSEWGASWTQSCRRRLPARGASKAYSALYAQNTWISPRRARGGAPPPGPHRQGVGRRRRR
jgi:hypothetical protein